MSHRTLILAFLATTVLGLAGLAHPAFAADLDENYGDAPPPVAEQKVEFGSGWYIRGDMGATRLPSMQLGTPSNLPTVSTVSQVPDAPSPVIGNGSRAGYTASIGGGYQFNTWFRTDVIVDFRQPIATTSSTGNGVVFCPTGVSYAGTAPDYGPPIYSSGDCTGTYQAKLSSYDALVNGYIDLGTWNRVTPYIGAGVGVSFGHYQDSASYVQANGVPFVNITYTDPKFNQTFTANYNRTGGASYQTLAWALMAGFSFDIFDHTKIDIGYRYLNLGSIPGISGTLTSNEVRAGVRYMVDN